MEEKKTGSSHAGIWTCTPTSSSEKSAVSDHWAMRPLRVLKYLSLPFTVFEPYGAVFITNSKIQREKCTFINANIKVINTILKVNRDN